MTKALVTGSSGFIGTQLIQALVSAGTHVSRLPRDFLYQPDELYNYCQEAKPDYIYHLASYGNMHQQTDEVKIFQANLIGTWNLLQATRMIPYQAFIHVSSSSVLLDHETIYSAAKAGAERLCKAFVDEYHLPVVSVRPMSVYGPGESDHRFIPSVFRSCLTGTAMPLAPDAWHDWVYLTDVVDTMLSIKRPVSKKPITIGTGFTYPNGDVVHMIEEITGKPCNITEYKQLRSFDNRNWQAGHISVDRTSLAEGLAWCNTYYQERYGKYSEKN